MENWTYIVGVHDLRAEPVGADAGFLRIGSLAGRSPLPEVENNVSPSRFVSPDLLTIWICSGLEMGQAT